MATQTVDVFCAYKRNNKTYDIISPALRTTYKPSTDTLMDLVPLALSKWCDVLNNVGDDLPACVTSVTKAVLIKHWKIIVTKVSRNAPPQPVESTEPSLNVDRLLSTAYRRMHEKPTSTLMPEIWLLPVSEDARDFAFKMDERKRAMAASGDGSPLSSGPPSPSSPSANRRAGGGASFDDDPAEREERIRVGDSERGGEFEPLIDSATPEKLSRWFDRQYLSHVDRKVLLFGAKCKDGSAPATAAYVHWSDAWQQASNARQQQQPSSPISSSTTLKKHHGDKGALSEALGVAWEAAAEAEADALAAFNRACAERKTTLDSSCAACEQQAAEALGTKQEMQRSLDGLTVKRAQIEAKTERLAALQQDVNALETRLDAARRIRDDAEEKRLSQKRAVSASREHSIAEGTRQRAAEHSPLLGRLDRLPPSTALEAAMSLLSPGTAASVQDALLGNPNASRESSSDPIDDFAQQQQQRQQQRRTPRIPNPGEDFNVNEYMDSYPVDEDEDDDVVDRSDVTAQSLFHGSNASRASTRMPHLHHQRQQQQHGEHHHHHHDPNQSTTSSASQWMQPGALAAAASSSPPPRGGASSSPHSGENPDVRVPLRLLASDLDAFLTRSLHNSSEASNLPQAMDSVPPATSDPTFFQEDVETKRRLLNRVHALKSSLTPHASTRHPAQPHQLHQLQPQQHQHQQQPQQHQQHNPLRPLDRR